MVLDLLPVRVFWKDKNLHYLGCNLAFAKDAGKNSPEEVIGTTDFELPWKSEAEIYRKDDREVITSGKPKIFYEEPQTTPDDKQLWLRTSKIPLMGPGGVPYGVLGMYEDITELKSLINTLNETMSLLKTLIDSAPIGIIAINEEGNIEFWNKTSEEILGWDIDEVLFKPIENFAPELNKKISQSEDTHPLIEVEIIEKNKKGNPLTLRVIHRFVRFSNRIPLILILFRDISEIKKVQEEKKQFQKQIQHIQKLESLGVLSSSVAHDFNNYLMAIMGHAELARAEINKPSAIANYLQNIEETIKDAGELCRQLLTFAGKKQQPYQPCNLNHIIKETEHLLKVSISKKILLDFQFDPELPLINGEIGQLRSVLVNLVINASDAIGNRSGVIRIKTGVVDFTESYIRTTWFQEGIEKKKYIYMEVSDNGCGMPPETMSKIFDPFFTTKDTGRGLGLATIMGIIRAHSGTIKVYSEVGKGTTFKLFFPAIHGIEEQPREINNLSSWKGKGLILFADDEPVVLQVTTKMLEKLGFTVITAKDGREALQLFNEHKNKFSAIILDITMPHLDGTDVARIIRSEFPNLPIFLSTGFLQHTFSENDIDFPIQGFLTKPYNINTLIKNLKNYL
ncbi:MAG: response regulator [Candidatus Hydrogenedens sp.]